MISSNNAFLGKIFSHLAYIDLFGKAVELNFNKGKKSRTRAGGFFTLFFFGFWIWAVYNVGKDIYQRKNPTMSTADIISVDPEPMVLSPETFSIAFGYSEPVVADHYRNESIFTMRVTLQNMQRNTHHDGSVTLDWSEIVLETETCTPEHFGQLSERFSTLQLDKLLCLKPNQIDTDSITIQGVYESKLFQYLQVSVLACNNATSNNTCGTPEELEYYLGGQGFFAAYFTDIAVNTRDYEHPTTSYQNSIFTLFGNKGYKELYFMLDHVEIYSDIGWFTKDESVKNYIKFETITETTTMVATEILLNFQMKVATTTKVFSRSYIKIQSILAQANGLATVALMALLFIMTPYANLKFNESIINELFEINPPDSKPEPPQITFINMNDSVDINSKEQITDVKRKPERTDSVALSIISPDNPREFESYRSPRPLLSHEKTPKDETGIVNEPPLTTLSARLEQKQTLPQITSGRITGGSGKDSLISLNTESNPIPLAEMIRRAEKRADIPRRRSTFAGMSTKRKSKSPSYISGPNSLIANKPRYKQPESIEPQDDLELKSIEMMLESLAFCDQDQENQENQENQDTKIDYLKVLPSPLQDSQQFESSITPKEDDKGYMSDVGNEFFSKLKKKGTKDFQKKMKSIENKMCQDEEEGGLNITFWDYLQSFVRKSDRYKQKIKFLNAGVKMINERLDIFELFRNFREVEKLKLLLLDYEQAVLFENLPKPLLHAQADESADPRSYHEQLLRTGKLVPENKKSMEVCEAYRNIAKRQGKNANIMDSKLLKVYDERFK